MGSISTVCGRLNYLSHAALASRNMIALIVGQNVFCFDFRILARKNARGTTSLTQIFVTRATVKNSKIELSSSSSVTAARVVQKTTELFLWARPPPVALREQRSHHSRRPNHRCERHLQGSMFSFQSFPLCLGVSVVNRRFAVSPFASDFALLLCILYTFHLLSTHYVH